MRQLAGIVFLSIASAIPGLSSVDAEETEFRAELVSIDSILRFEGKALVVSFNPKFVARFKLLEDVAHLGKKDETIAFAIHSPARDLAVDYSKLDSFIGKERHLKLTRRSDGKSNFLQLARFPLDFLESK